MMQSAFATLCCGCESIEQLMTGVAQLLPMLDVIPNAAIFIKDTQALQHGNPLLLRRLLDGQREA